MKWMEALKQYNSGKAMWCIPKKGSPEYFDVRALMGHDSAKDIEARNVERREKSVAQLREATKHMKPGVREDDYEAMNAERRNKSVAQLREATKHMKPGVRVDEAPKGVKEIVKAIEKKKKEPKQHFVDIEGWLDKLIGIHLVEEGIKGAKDNNVEKVLQKIKDDGDYVEYLTEAIDGNGGEEEIAEKIYKYFTVKKRIPKSAVVNKMKQMEDYGYSMFDKYTKK